MGAKGQPDDVSSRRNRDGALPPGWGGAYSGSQHSAVIKRSTSMRGPLQVEEEGGDSCGGRKREMDKANRRWQVG